MSLLTDEEIDACWLGPMPSGAAKSRYDIAKALQAAILAKLASAELPEPATPNESGSTQCIVRWLVETPFGWIGSYEKEAISEICRQAYAQGAAAQLAEKPSAWVYKERGQKWLTDIFKEAEHEADEGTLIELYTRRQA